MNGQGWLAGFEARDRLRNRLRHGLARAFVVGMGDLERAARPRSSQHLGTQNLPIGLEALDPPEVVVGARDVEIRLDVGEFPPGNRSRPS